MEVILFKAAFIIAALFTSCYLLYKIFIEND